MSLRLLEYDFDLPGERGMMDRPSGRVRLICGSLLSCEVGTSGRGMLGGTRGDLDGPASALTCDMTVGYLADGPDYREAIKRRLQSHCKRVTIACCDET